MQSEQDYLNKPEVSIKIPEELRPLLVDDWDLVIKQMKLVSLPAKPTVARIFEDYIREKKNARNISPAKLRLLKNLAFIWYKIDLSKAPGTLQLKFPENTKIFRFLYLFKYRKFGLRKIRLPESKINSWDQ